MSSPAMTEESSALAGLARAWWLFLIGGLISIVIGIFFMVNTAAAIGVLALLFAIYLFVSGIYEIIRGFGHGISGGMRTLLFITGALSLIIGFVALRSYWTTDTPLVSDWIFSIFVGITFLFRGFAWLFTGIDSKGMPGRGWNIFAGICGIIVGIIILLSPIELVTLVWVIGIWLIVMGIFEVISSFMVRSKAA